ncbi:hypothetical protein XhyaCFBP1156_03265 [Xanthomonas hyacinthi]|uniref:Uncharacterized protein n=1 Tax=Xanthomonas hyacinthi TaxID=56455 RepID=A0A2S7F1Q6_9XANT|nr:hypothetical protein XhyaCFBP1156_03265 [Xanthomonas hyacinthi]
MEVVKSEGAASGGKEEVLSFLEAPFLDDGHFGFWFQRLKIRKGGNVVARPLSDSIQFND